MLGILRRTVTIRRIERELAAARKRLEATCKTLPFPRTEGKDWAEYDDAREVVLRLERELAAAKGEEYAVPVDFPVIWDVGAPSPHLLQNDSKTFLTFFLNDPDPNWDGSYATARDPMSEEPASLALVEFHGCASARLGTPNDEVHSGHPLYSRGLDSYTAQKIENSRWLAEAEAINSVHGLYRSERWRELNHYVFWFHDTTFECLAESYTVELSRQDLKSLLSVVCERLLF